MARALRQCLRNHKVTGKVARANAYVSWRVRRGRGACTRCACCNGGGKAGPMVSSVFLSFFSFLPSCGEYCGGVQCLACRLVRDCAEVVAARCRLAQSFPFGMSADSRRACFDESLFFIIFVFGYNVLGNPSGTSVERLRASAQRECAILRVLFLFLRVFSSGLPVCRRPRGREISLRIVIWELMGRFTIVRVCTQSSTLCTVRRIILING